MKITRELIVALAIALLLLCCIFNGKASPDPIAAAWACRCDSCCEYLDTMEVVK